MFYFGFPSSAFGTPTNSERKMAPAIRDEILVKKYEMF